MKLAISFLYDNGKIRDVVSPRLNLGKIESLMTSNRNISLKILFAFIIQSRSQRAG